MRILLATTIVIFAATTAQAQGPAQSADDQAVQSIVEKLKATRNVKSDAKPSEVAPAEAKPADSKPVEVKPVESKTVEQKSADARPAQTAKKRVVVKNRETHEQTARRLAEKYGLGLELE